jgi:hypothetical protein
MLLFIYILLDIGLRLLKPAWLQRSPSELLLDLSKSFTLPNLESNELLVVRAPGDESSSGLAAIRLFSVLYDFASRAFERVSTVGVWLTEVDQHSTSSHYVWVFSACSCLYHLVIVFILQRFSHGLVSFLGFWQDCRLYCWFYFFQS